jgi:hypothetical protein
MALRPVFLPQVSGPVLVKTLSVSFQWFPGMSISQKQKSIAALHGSAVDSGVCVHPLEVSSKSSEELGVALSAFYLGSHTLKNQSRFTVETLFQSSKVFELGGPFRELLHATSREAKKDDRLKNSGRLIRFDLFGQTWPLEPKTAFYDWVYINTLTKNPELIERLRNYDAFTDIEFNPERSINCQAYSLALFKALVARRHLDRALSSKTAFLDLVSSGAISNAHESTDIQPRLV